MRVLITGITGFAGSHLADFLVAEHPEVEVFGTYRWRSRRDNIEHLDGKVTLRVPPGTSSGRTFRVTGKGVATAEGAGDLLVTVEVTVPDHLSDEARALLEQLRREESGHNPRAHLGV